MNASSRLARLAPVAVTGATGYIGGRLVPKLLESGWRVRCLSRNARKLAARPFAADPRVESVECDLDDEAAVARALEGCGSAYYLVHSMLSAGAEYDATDRRLAGRFGRAAAVAGVRRIVYLGGLGESDDALSEHLRSRRQVEDELRRGGVPVTALRAAMILGTGSASFEILRYLVERLPVMVTPRWVRTECQPISVADVLEMLAACLDRPATEGETIDVGGPDVVTYAELMQMVAQARGLPRRVILPVPVLTPRLSALWIHLVTPVPAAIARPLAEGLCNRVVCSDSKARRLLPPPRFGAHEAIVAALGEAADGSAAGIETRWSDAGLVPGDPDWAGGTTFVDRREIAIEADPRRVFRAVCRVGGGHGWYFADGLWRLRGLLDRLFGGPGLRRGRRDPETVGYGEALDFWRVIALEPDRRIELFAEMKLPGVATLEFVLEPLAPAAPGGARRTRLRQVARFRPRGLLGLLYWWAVLPCHGFVFRGMLAGIRRAACSLPAESNASEVRHGRVGVDPVPDLR